MFFSNFVRVLCINADFVIECCALIRWVELHCHLNIDVVGSGMFVIIMRRRLFYFCVNLISNYFLLAWTLQFLDFASCRLVLICLCNRIRMLTHQNKCR
jgi:membrane protein implicated in regulation of membrane protease activity